MPDLGSSIYKKQLKMSYIDSDHEGQASPTGSGEGQAQSDKATSIASYRSKKKIFTEEEPLTTGCADNDSDRVISRAFKRVDFDSAAAEIQPLSQDDVAYIINIFPHYDMLIDNPDFYTMTVAWLNLLRKLYKIRAGRDIVIPAAADNRFHPKAHFRPHLQKLWLLYFLGALVEALMQFADNAITQSPLQSLVATLSTQTRTPRSPGPMNSQMNVQRRVSLHPVQVNEEHPQEKTDTHFLHCSSYAGFSHARFSWIRTSKSTA